MKGQVKFGLKGGFSAQQLAAVKAQTLKVLAELGVEIDHAGILKYLAGIKGVKVTGRRARFAPALVEKHLELIRRENGDYTFVRAGEHEWTLRPAYLCLNHYDVLTGEIRRATSADLRRAVKVCDAYGLSGTSPLQPQDFPEGLRQAGMLKICLENSRNVGRWMMAKDEREARWLCRMAEAAGRTPPHVMMQITISPLRLNTEYLEIVFNHRKKDDYLKGITVGGGSIPMLGATGPLLCPAAWVQATAEAIASHMTVKLIDPRVSGVCSTNMLAFDLRRACSVLGSPEGLLARLLSLQLNAQLFGFRRGASLAAMGLPLDAQSSAEKLANLLLEALGGARVFYDLGMTPMDEIFCPEQLLFDRELVHWVRRFVEGVKYDDRPEAVLGTLRDGIAEGSYLMHASTVATHREFYWTPELFQYRTVASIHADPQWKPLPQRARAIVERDLARHQFALPPDAQRELDRLYAAAEKDLAG